MYNTIQSLEHNYYDIESYLLLKQIPTPLLEKICKCVLLYDYYDFNSNEHNTEENDNTCQQVPLEDCDYFYILSSYNKNNKTCPFLYVITHKHIQLLKKYCTYYLNTYGNIIMSC
jgi:hypothetical protein